MCVLNARDLMFLKMRSKVVVFLLPVRRDRMIQRSGVPGEESDGIRGGEVWRSKESGLH